MASVEPSSYLAWASTRLPRWLLGGVEGWGSRFIEAVGVVVDAVTGGARNAAKVRLPSEAPVDAVRYIAAERGLEQYPSETAEAWRERLGRAWDQWHEAGRPAGIVSQLERYGIASVEVVEHFTTALTPGDGNARFVVVLGDGVDAASLPWSASLLGGFELGDENTLGSTATPAEVRAVRRIVRKWKAAHSLSVAIVLRFVGGTVAAPFWPRTPFNAECTWVHANNTLGIGLRSMPFSPVGYREDAA